MSDEAIILDMEEIVDDSLRELENRRLRHHMERLEASYQRLQQIEDELEIFLRSKPEIPEENPAAGISPGSSRLPGNP